MIAALVEAQPCDVAWVHLDVLAACVALGRHGRPFHTRERLQMALLGRVADGLFAAALDRPQPLTVE